MNLIQSALVAGNRFRVAVALAGAIICQAWASGEASGVLLWEIGKADGGNAEFSLAPNRYHDFRGDGFFVVGRSESGRDWP